ncbi:MAG TPA: purine-nucleoside phosphorylase [Chitinophagaceae bacterium]|nr:purine-nucleoside phosphorylase [Chitinophagaceae bacterium]
MSELLSKIKDAVTYIKSQSSTMPEVGMVLGSGLGNLVKEIEIEKEIDYHDIPHFPVSTVEGHKGKLIIGKLSGKAIVAMAGRFHFYEGYSPTDVVFPIRVMKYLGIKTLFLSNAAGGVNPSYKVGDMMIIKDHIGLFVPNPLIGKNEKELGTRFPDMSEPYKKELIDKAKQIGKRLHYDLKEGVYVAVTGPTYETRAEYKMVHVLGGDAVGMSTVQETIAANHMGLPVFAISVITDVGIREDENIITHEEVLEAAKKAEPKLTVLIKEMVASI